MLPLKFDDFDYAVGDIAAVALVTLIRFCSFFEQDVNDALAIHASLPRQIL